MLEDPLLAVRWWRALPLRRRGRPALLARFSLGHTRSLATQSSRVALVLAFRRPARRSLHRLPEAPLAEPDQPTETWTWIVPTDHQRPFRLGARDQRLARRDRHRGVEVERRVPLWLAELHRMVRHIARDQRMLALRNDPDRDMGRSVAGRRKRDDLGGDRRLVLDEIELASILEWHHRILDVRVLRGDLGLRPVLPLAPHDRVARARKERHETPLARDGVPTHVVDVQVRDQHDIHVLRRDAMWVGYRSGRRRDLWRQCRYRRGSASQPTARPNCRS